MELKGKVVVVTGAGGGIGGALAKRFHADGATVVLSDLPGTPIEERAAALNAVRPDSAVALAGNIGREVEVAGLIAESERRCGPIDLFFANAGIALGTDPVETPDSDWDLIWRVNVMQHVWAARYLVPGWLERGEGYFCSTASAAGLLAQIGSATYSVTKAGAVSFAEYMAITYGDRGIKVSCLCPQGVNTNMLNGGIQSSGVDSRGAAAVKAGGNVLEPDDVAEIVLQHIHDEKFLILPHPEVAEYERRKVSDRDRWLAGMRRLQSKVAGLV